MDNAKAIFFDHHQRLATTVFDKRFVTRSFVLEIWLVVCAVLCVRCSALFRVLGSSRKRRP